MEDDYSIVYQPETMEFVTVAKEFAAFMESARDFTKEAFLDRSIKILPLLYLKGTLLPEVDICNTDVLEKFVSEAAWAYIQQVTSSKLDEDDDYVQVQDIGIVSSMDSLSVGLSEIYADLYQEMADVVAAYRTRNDEVMLAAIACCKENFSIFWGIRLLTLLKALHEINYKQNDV